MPMEKNGNFKQPVIGLNSASCIVTEVDVSYPESERQQDSEETMQRHTRTAT